MCDNLFEHRGNLTNHVDEITPVDVVYVDMAKAFDTVLHKHLPTKIKAHGIHGMPPNCIKPWLSGHKQRVITQGVHLNWTDQALLFRALS